MAGSLRYLRFTLDQPQARVRVWLMDESRFGLRTDLKRRLTLRGIKPVGRYQHPRACFWLYGVADALSGTSYFRAFMRLSATNFQTFVDDIQAAYPDELHLMLLDNSRTHLAHDLQLPPTMRLHFLPPYSPDLNPLERLWQHIKAPLAGLWSDSILHLQEHLAAVIETLDDATIFSIVSPQWLQVAALNAGLAV